MTDREYVDFLQWALPQLRLRWEGFRRVRGQVNKRLNRRLSELGLVGVEAYRAYLESHPEEWPVLDCLCRISISRFYRDRSVFDHLASDVMPELARIVAAEANRELRVWSAGCASGEEPYTMAMLWYHGLKEKFGPVRLRVIATDADPHLLRRAREARYPASSLKDLPKELVDTFFQRGGRQWLLQTAMLPGVEFQEQDIREDVARGPFHLVLCRNLAFTYFEKSLQQEVLAGIDQQMAPGGVLVIGKHEAVLTEETALRELNRKLGFYGKVD